MSYVSTLTLKSTLADMKAEQTKCIAELNLATTIQEECDIEYHLEYLEHAIREETRVNTGYYLNDYDDYDMIIDDEDDVM